MKKLLLLCTTAAAFVPTAAFAQSTGTDATEANKEAETIVVTGTRSRGVAGVVVPDVPKTRSILTNELLVRQSEGQSVLQSINLVPGVNFTNSDPYGSSGGNLRIRGFPGNRVALLFDGLPLNDTGNYAIFSNQQMDQEIIDQVSVNLGTTDVDSPTPSAAGGVVSYRTLVPGREFGGLIKGALGDFSYSRLFGLVETGELAGTGIRGFVSGSYQKYDKFKGPGELKKQQGNARLYKALGTNGDFISLAWHYNRNRNNSYNNGLVSDYRANKLFDNIEQCARDLPTAGVADNDGSSSTAASNITGLAPSTCTNYYNLRINPSDTGNLRGAVRLTLAPGLIFTADPGYQHVLANGGGTATVSENDARLRGQSTAAGVDLNGDGDFLDTVRLYQPSNTRTNRYTLLTSLIYELSDSQRVRLAYTFDRGRHRQTGEFGRIEENGDPISVFGGKYNESARIVSADGKTLQNRDRLSIAQLQQLSFEYFGKFLDNRLTATVGIRAPFFRRELNQYCYTLLSSGNPVCTSETINPARILKPGVALPAGPAPSGGYVYAPFERTVKYSPVLPSAGIAYDFAGGHSLYASYGKNFSSPSTDNLYRSVSIDVKPETTNSYELGYRFKSGKVQAQLAGFYVDYKNRIVTAQDLDPTSQTFGSTLDRNVGDARAYGLDGQVSWRPFKNTSLYAYVSHINSKLKDNILGRAGGSGCLPNTTVGTQCVVVLTKGAEFVETPQWTFGGRAQQDISILSFGVQAKWVDARYSTDDNGRDGRNAAAFNNLGDLPINLRGKTSSYTVVDADVKAKLDAVMPGLFFRGSVINLFDKYYFGNINTQNNLAGGPRFSVGAPRTFQGTIGLDF
ncbi:TonB-dependent receptor [Sphingomonas astaxanthinifaciens]|uniref:TonB-dependent receptor n=1 Tax=Sphingomonas astaxanthinifaciens DSM 22298 TaxID=1123267 RepID=A0ABQ5Z6H0_9SPHN|nr:TonB-dependent receptor [Sphingomonas astaxanthinifaciens]GLR46374.1 TonB-dependent receptor [Sphingomonas astaxanthinifaciens DSM 22298]